MDDPPRIPCYRLTGEFWINSTAWDSYSLYRLLGKFKRKSSFLFVGKGKLFIMELFFEEFYFIFFTAERLACFEMQPRQQRFGEFYCMVKKISTFVKGNLCTYQCFIDVKFISVSVLKEKLQNVPDWRWCDFVLNFPVCSADFHLRKRIHVLVKYYADCF